LSGSESKGSNAGFAISFAVAGKRKKKSVLKCVAVRWSVLQCNAVYYCRAPGPKAQSDARFALSFAIVGRRKTKVCWGVLMYVGVCWSVLECVELCWGVLQCVGVCWSVLECVGVFCVVFCWSVLQCITVGL